MGLGERILGFVSAPFVGERTENDKWVGINYSGSADTVEEKVAPFISQGVPQPQQMVPYDRLDVPGDSIFNRAYGTHTLIPGRALSAQTRLKNMTWELPASVWTENPEGPAYIVRVPGLPQQVINLNTLNNFTTQPEYLQPVNNLQIQNEISWMDSFRAKLFGQSLAQRQQQLTTDQLSMFPSIFEGNINIPQSFMSGAE